MFAYDTATFCELKQAADIKQKYTNRSDTYFSNTPI